MNSTRKIRAVAGVSLLELFRRRDVYAALILGLVLILPLAMINFFGVEGIVRHLREAALLMIWIFSIGITITTAARQFPGELERRTILPLLAKPVARSELVLGKFLGSFLASACALLLYYFFYLILTGWRSGQWFDLTLAQAVFIHLCFVMLLAAMTLAGSMILTPAANLTCCSLITVGMLLFGDRLTQVAAEATVPMNWIIRFVHYVLPHFEFYDSRVRIIHEWGPYSAGLLGIVFLYTVAYTTAFIILAIFLFKRKRL